MIHGFDFLCKTTWQFKDWKAHSGESPFLHDELHKKEAFLFSSAANIF